MTAQTGMDMTQAATVTQETGQDTGAAVLDTPETTKDTQAAQDERVSPKLQALIRREKSAVEKERAAKAREAEIQAREAKIQEFENLKKTNPKKALELLGLSYQELTQLMLSDQETTPEFEIKKLREELDSYKNSQVEALRRQEEELKKSEERKEAEVITQFKSEITKHLSENAERYEFIAFDQCEDLVYETIDEHYERTKDPETGIGQVMSIKDAADKVEAYLEKKYEKAPSLKKLQAFLARKPESKTPAKPQPQERQTPKTLNNTLSATPSKAPTRVVTDEERIAKAIAYAKGLRP